MYPRMERRAASRPERKVGWADPLKSSSAYLGVMGNTTAGRPGSASTRGDRSRSKSDKAKVMHSPFSFSISTGWELPTYEGKALGRLIPALVRIPSRMADQFSTVTARLTATFRRSSLRKLAALALKNPEANAARRTEGCPGFVRNLIIEGGRTPTSATARRKR